MKPAIRARWVAALRSNQYKQIGQELHYGANCFCVLGVLCELYRKEAVVNGREDPPIWQRNQYGRYEFVDPAALPSELSAWLPPTTVLEWAGLSPATAGTLQYYNDIEEYTFNELADLLEYSSEDFNG